MKRGSYRTFAELKSVFGNVDKVGNVFVFNIGGNEVPHCGDPFLPADVFMP